MGPSRVLLGLVVAAAVSVPLVSAGRDYYRILGVSRNADEKYGADGGSAPADRTRLRRCSAAD